MCRFLYVQVVICAGCYMCRFLYAEIYCIVGRVERGRVERGRVERGRVERGRVVFIPSALRA